MVCRRVGIVSAVLLACLVVLALPASAGAQPPAESAVLLIGDGMGPVHVQIAHTIVGQPLAMEKMPVSGLVATHQADGSVTDSAAAATALATGHKTKNGMVGVTPDGQRTENILERARALGKSTGVITTDSLTGATPAGFSAHVDSRGKRAEIAAQAAQSGSKVMLGFWKGDFLPKAAGGEREDGRDLIAEMQKAGYEIVYTQAQLEGATGKRIAGFFEDGPQAPQLADMVGKALAVLSQNPKGFVLAVESARIDWSSHENELVGAVRATLELDAAAGTAVEFARKRGRTLVVVTADHETGRPRIDDASKLGLMRDLKTEPAEIAKRLNTDRTNIGQVMREYAGISDLTEADLKEIRQATEAAAGIAKVISARAGVSWYSTGHTESRVPVFAFGPGADRFSGEMDNTDIPKRIAEAIGLGAFPK
jgi:alkaline phosphatase